MSLLSMWGSPSDREMETEEGAHARAAAAAAHARALAARLPPPLNFAAFFSYLYGAPLPLQPPRPPPGLIRPIPSRGRPFYIAEEAAHQYPTAAAPIAAIASDRASSSSRSTLIEVNVTEDEDDSAVNLPAKRPSEEITGGKEFCRKSNVGEDDENRDPAGPSAAEAPPASEAGCRAEPRRPAEAPAPALDVACCDGPVRFQRVLNDAYDAAAAAAAAHAARPPDRDDDSVADVADEPPDADRDGDGPFSCAHCDHAFKSAYCYRKHASRHLNPVVRGRRSPRPLDMNVQYYPCKSCGCKFPSYYFVHKHRKQCHPDEECSQEGTSAETNAGVSLAKRKCKSSTKERNKASNTAEPTSSSLLQQGIQ